MSEDSKVVSIRRGKSDKDTKIRSALDYIKAREEGINVKEAAEAAGVNAYSDDIKDRLERLAAFKMDANDAMKDAINARMMSIILYGTDGDSVAAAKILAMNPSLGLGGTQGAAVEINISEGTMKLEAGKLWDKKEGEG